MTDPLAVPAGPLPAAALALARRTEAAPIADHSLRSFLFARLLAEKDGSASDAAYDEELLFAACVLHDLGLGTLAPGQTRFEVEGADLAASVLTEHGIAAPDVERVWEAIALHSSIGIAERCGLLTSLTYRGVFTDAGRVTELDPAQLQAIFAAYPRPDGPGFLQDAIVAHATRSPATSAPPYSIAAELLRQRNHQR